MVSELDRRRRSTRVSPLVERLQVVGGSLITSPRLREVDDGVFATHREEGLSLAEQLIVAHESGEPFISVEVVPRGGMFDDALYRVLGTPEGHPLVYSVGISAEAEMARRIFDLVSLSVPGEHLISLDGHYGNRIAACQERVTCIPLDKPGQYGYGSSYGHEDSVGMSRAMRQMLDRIEAEFPELQVSRRSLIQRLREVMKNKNTHQ